MGNSRMVGRKTKQMQQKQQPAKTKDEGQIGKQELVFSYIQKGGTNKKHQRNGRMKQCERVMRNSHPL